MSICANYLDIFKTFLDDCVYRYFVCTERVGRWPENNEKCTQLFKRCCKYIEGTEDDLNSHGILTETTTRPEAPPEIIRKHYKIE